MKAPIISITTIVVGIMTPAVAAGTKCGVATSCEGVT